MQSRQRDEARFSLGMLGSAIVDVIRDEASFLAKYESNWREIYGLPGRREPHLVGSLHAHLRAKFEIRCVLDDSFLQLPKTRCDLVVRLDESRDRWAWIEMKTMPKEDAPNKLAALHNDLVKLRGAAEADRRNMPQAIVAVGYDVPGGNLAMRIVRFAEEHGLDRWPHRFATGVEQLELPSSPRAQHYSHAIIGCWARESHRSKIAECDGRCHLAS